MIKFFDIPAFHVAFIGTVAQGDALHEGVGSGTQVDEQVRQGDLFSQSLVNAVIHLQFIPGQVDAGEEGILGEGVIGKQGPARGDDSGDTPALLVIAAEKEEDLGLEGVTGAVRIEIREERVLLKDLEQHIGIK